MAFRKVLIIVFPLILIGCAQVGQLSGGNKDDFAPKPIEGQTIPPNESTNFKGNSFEMTFDEFIQLNNPQQTLFIVPNHAKLKASIHKKTVKIEWDEQLQENTTYVIYMNGTVKDVTENNDSLISYVFSTGDRIDSLRYSVTVRDAWTNEYLKDATVGLFTPQDSLKPYYFSKVNRFGIAQFDYLKAGTYQLKAFVDDNKDMLIQPTEAIAFGSGSIQLDSSIVDTIPLRMSKPAVQEKITSFKFQAPESFIVGANFSLDEATYRMNGRSIDLTDIRKIHSDSVQLFFPVKDLSTFELVVQTKSLSDTSTIRLTEKEKSSSLQLIPEFNLQNLGPHQSFSFLINDKINKIDTSKIYLTDPSDSMNVPFKVNFSLNRFELQVDRSQHAQLALQLKKGAVESERAHFSDSTTFFAQLKTEKDFGLITLKASSFDEQIIVELLQNEKVITSVVLNDQKEYAFRSLTPGEYSFRVIKDRNKNSRWDTGNAALDLQPEEVLWFSTPTKVRANWDIDVNLTPNQ
jgi:uncharacterized protein (DUF2141 family)